MLHDQAQRLAVFAVVIQRADLGGDVAQVEQKHIRRSRPVGCDRAIKTLGNETGGAAGDVDVFADQVGIDTGDEVIRIEIDVLDLGTQFGGDVIAQPFRIHAELQIAQR